MSIPNYKKPVRVSRPAATPPIDVRRRTAGSPYLPPVNTDATPPVDTYIYLVYLNNGAYYGWMDEKEAHKWLFTMYYPTGNKYKIRTKKGYDITDRGDRSHKIVFETLSTNTALVFVNKYLKETDIIDPSDIKKKVEHTIKGIQELSDIGTYLAPDPFGLLGGFASTARQEYQNEKAPYDQVLTKLQAKYEQDKKDIYQQMKDGPGENLRKKLITRLKDMADAQDEIKKGSEEAEANLDF